MSHLRSPKVIEKMVYEKNLYAIFYAKVIKPNHVASPREFTVNQSAFSKKYYFKEKAVLPVYYQHPRKLVLPKSGMSYIQ